MKQHASLSPSQAHRWMVCPASYYLCTGENVATSYASVGTFCHQLVENYVRSNIDPEQYRGMRVTVDDGTLFGYDFVVDNEILDAVHKCLFYVKQYKNFKVESIVDFKDLLDKVACPDFNLDEEGYGTCDGIALLDDELHVYDWKFGKGVKVYVKDYEDGQFEAEKLNPQLGLYAYGAMNSLPSYKRNRIHTVKLTVVQPLIDHVDSVDLTMDELRAFAQYVRLRGSYVGTSTYNVSNKGCRWCVGKAMCPAIWQNLMDLASEKTDDL
jgi:hypothetical protein